MYSEYSQKIVASYVTILAFPDHLSHVEKKRNIENRIFGTANIGFKCKKNLVLFVIPEIVLC